MQKVNLYNAQLVPKPEEMPIKSLWIALAVGGLFAIGLWFSEWSEVNLLRKQSQTLLSQKNNLQQQVKQLEAIIPSAEEKNSALIKIRKLQRQLQQQQKTSELISALNENQTAGYFGVLENLSQLEKKKYWITRIIMHADQLSLEGETFESAAVANMVNQLQQMPNTKNINFSKVIIEREKSQDRSAKFYLYTTTQEAVNGN